MPLLDRSALLGEPELAAAVVQAIIGAVRAAEGRYPPASAAVEADASGGGDHTHRLVMARRLCDAERAALRETQREALKLLVNAGLDEEDESDSEQDSGEGSDDGGGDPRAKRQRAR